MAIKRNWMKSIDFGDFIKDIDGHAYVKVSRLVLDQDSGDIIAQLEDGGEFLAGKFDATRYMQIKVVLDFPTPIYLPIKMEDL